MKKDLLNNKNRLTSISQAETIRKLNETKQYTLMATALLERVLTDSKLTPFAAKLWEYLYTKAVMNDKLSVKIKYKDLAEKFDRSERSMKRYVNNLKENGYLGIESNFHYHGQRANTFYLRAPENILKLIEQTKDRNKTIVREFSSKEAPLRDKDLKQTIDKPNIVHSSAVDKIVTPDHDRNVTPNNNIKKNILINNNNVVVDNFSEPKKIVNSTDFVLHGTNSYKKPDIAVDSQIKIREIEKTVNNLYVKMGKTTGEERIFIFGEIRKLQANITAIQMMMNQKKQSIRLLTGDMVLKVSPEFCSPTDLSQAISERKLSEQNIARIKESIRKIVSQKDQQRVCNEIIYAVRFGALKIAQNGELLSISHAISIALKLVREKRWETPTPMQTKENYAYKTKFDSLKLDLVNNAAWAS